MLYKAKYTATHSTEITMQEHVQFSAITLLLGQEAVVAATGKIKRWERKKELIKSGN